MSTLWRNKKNILWIPSLIWRYAKYVISYSKNKILYPKYSEDMPQVKNLEKRICAVCHSANIFQGPVVQSVISLTSSLRVISLTILADSMHNILIFFAEKM